MRGIVTKTWNFWIEKFQSLEHLRRNVFHPAKAFSKVNLWLFYRKIGNLNRERKSHGGEEVLTTGGRGPRPWNLWIKEYYQLNSMCKTISNVPRQFST